MKQYNNVYVPCPREESTHTIRKGDQWLEACAKEHSNAVLMSIEELRELWKAGAQHGYESDFGGPAPDLETYLQSKGLTIKQQ